MKTMNAVFATLGLITLGAASIFMAVFLGSHVFSHDTPAINTYEKGVVGEFMVIEEFYMFDDSNIKETLIQNKETKKCYIYSPGSMSPFSCNI